MVPDWIAINKDRTTGQIRANVLPDDQSSVPPRDLL